MIYKRCPRCPPGKEKPATVEFFQKANGRGDGLSALCKVCDRARQRERSERSRLARDIVRATVKARAADEQEHLRKIAAKVAQDARLESDYAELKPEDFAVGVGNDGRHEGGASEEKRQEYSKSMGEFAEALRNGEGLDEKLGKYIGGLAEQERRFANRRLSRSVSISAAHQELARELTKDVARQFFADKITPTGYAIKPSKQELKRTVLLGLSDLHLGANMDARSNPIPFRAVEEARRLEFVMRQGLDYKPQYRDQSELLMLINGDVIDGFLMHDQRAGIPLAEQKAVFWHHFRIAIALASQQYPKVHVECQPGNHGRNVARHPGRATEDKWDGIEWDMYFALAQMCSSLPNVTFGMPFQAVSKITRYGQNLLMVHGDTEPKLGDPDTKAKENAATFDRVNATRLYGCEFSAMFAGHFHKSRIHPNMIFNGCLVPPNGHARSSGYFGEPCAQTLWEWVEGFPVGDIRRIFVGPAQDKDERLGTLIPPFRFPKPAGD